MSLRTGEAIMPKALSEELEGPSALFLALRLMQDALGFLDDSDAPADIGAHLDHAVVRLGLFVAGLTAA